MQATTIRPKITVTADGQGVASHVGFRLLAGLGAMTGLDQAFADAVCGGRQRRSAYDPGRVLADLAVLLADGGETISDLGVLRDQPDVFGQVASTATAQTMATSPPANPRSCAISVCMPPPASPEGQRRTWIRIGGTWPWPSDLAAAFTGLALLPAPGAQPRPAHSAAPNKIKPPNTTMINCLPKDQG